MLECGTGVYVEFEVDESGGKVDGELNRRLRGEIWSTNCGECNDK